MDHFGGLDVSVKQTSLCIVDDAGRIVREVKVASEPEALLQVLKQPCFHLKRIGLEAGPLAQWLFNALAEAGLPVICVNSSPLRRCQLACRLANLTRSNPIPEPWCWQPPRRAPGARNRRCWCNSSGAAAADRAACGRPLRSPSVGALRQSPHPKHGRARAFAEPIAKRAPGARSPTHRTRKIAQLG